MGEIDLDGPDPIYVQIAAVLQARILDGTYPPNRRIPSESAIVAEFEVARNTARSAIKLLVERGLIRVVRGRGSFVKEQPAE